MQGAVLSLMTFDSHELGELLVENCLCDTSAEECEILSSWHYIFFLS